MEFEDKTGRKHAASLLDTEVPGADERRGIETRRQKSQIAASLFDEPATPIKIGRFTIVRELGAGGMGVVYVAYDEQLDRRVAVKLLRGSEADTEAKLRLQREAQAMARLSHPNVVTVHEVGTFQGQVFVAMEFIDGMDLRGWLKAERHDWRSVVAIFSQAGEGLAAAHDGGIVHRDFKPDNVLVGNDGRVRVADFGLAHAFDAALVENPRPRTKADKTDISVGETTVDEEISGRLDASLTKTGAIMGTPAYMAPEQFEGLRTDARSDQFSFCVALWEGLYGRRPFTGENLVALSYAVMDGKIEAAPTDAQVPAWLHAVLIRGLAPLPENRWLAMRPLLDALAKDPEIRRKRVLRWTALASVTSALLGGLVWLAGTQLAQNARQQYWNELTEQLLELERERGFRQASDDALRARDATRMSVYRSYRPKGGVVDHEDPTVAAVLLREVEGEARESEAWVSAANEILGRPISKLVLTGHSDSIDALGFSPDAKFLYSGSADGTVRRWDLANGHSEPIITHDEEVTGLAVSPDGQSVVSISKDGTARMWTGGTATVRKIVEHRGEVTSVAFSHSGGQVVTTSKDGSARIHELSTGEDLVLPIQGVMVYSAGFDPTDEHVFTGSDDDVVRLWRARDGRLLSAGNGHEDPIFHGRFIDSNRLITASDDGSVRLWHVENGALTEGQILVQHPAAITAFDVRGERTVSADILGSVLVGTLDGSGKPSEIRGHTDGVWAAAFTPKGDRVVTGSFDTTARLTNVDGGGVAQVLVGHRISIFRLALDSSGRWLATGSYDGSIRVWDINRPRLEIPLVGHVRTIFRAEFDTQGDRVVTASHDGTARVWGVADGSLLAALSGGNTSNNDATFSPDGGRVAVATETGIVESWDLATGTHHALIGHSKTVWDVTFSPQGDRIASASFDGTARIWDAATGAELAVLNGHRDKVTGVNFEPEGNRLVTASHDGTVRFWDVASGQERAVLTGHHGKIWMIARGPDGRTLATASDDATARLWPDQKNEHSVVLLGHTKPIWSIAFDVDGNRVVTASFDGTARVWDAGDGSLLAVLEGHAAGLWDARFLPDGRVVTVSDDKTVRIWTVGSTDSTIVLSDHSDGVTALAVSSDGSRILSGSGSGDATAKIWRVDLLNSDKLVLHRRLEDVTMYCLTAEQRVRELGDDWRDAEDAVAACELAGQN